MSDELWAAVDSLTKSTRRRVHRDPDEVASLAEVASTFCRVDVYRDLISEWGVVPSLWEQAELALETGREQQEGHGSPKALRSPADLDLMETMLTIRESMSWQLKGRDIDPRPTMPEQMRQLAAHVVGREPQHVEWWTYRFQQWARMLGTYLRAVETGPKPVRLRAACPLCRTRHVTLDTDSGPIVVGPILIDFVNGWIRAATCTACTATWWRGEQLGQLATAIENADTPHNDVAV